MCSSSPWLIQLSQQIREPLKAVTKPSPLPAELADPAHCRVKQPDELGHLTCLKSLMSPIAAKCTSADLKKEIVAFSLSKCNDENVGQGVSKTVPPLTCVRIAHLQWTQQSWSLCITCELLI